MKVRQQRKGNESGERRKRDKRRKSTRHKAKSRKVIVQNNTGITSNKKGNEYLWVPNIPLDSPPEEDSDVIGFETVCVWRWVRFYLVSLLLFYYSYSSSYDFLGFLILISSFISLYYHHSIVISPSLLLSSNSVFLSLISILSIPIGNDKRYMLSLSQLHIYQTLNIIHHVNSLISPFLNVFWREKKMITSHKKKLI